MQEKYLGLDANFINPGEDKDFGQTGVLKDNVDLLNVEDYVYYYNIPTTPNGTYIVPTEDEVWLDSNKEFVRTLQNQYGFKHDSAELDSAYFSNFNVENEEAISFALGVEGKRFLYKWDYNGQEYFLLVVKNENSSTMLSQYTYYYYVYEGNAVEEVFTDIVDTKTSTAGQLQGAISTWYKALRVIALVGLLSVLVYVGIRIILSSTGQEKAKYKKMITDWLVAICLLFILHYIMAFTMQITDSILDIFNNNENII